MIDTKAARDNLAENVKFLMAERKMSLSELADAATSKTTTMHRLIHAENDPAFTLVARIADYFNVSTDDLMKTPKAFQRLWRIKEKAAVPA